MRVLWVCNLMLPAYAQAKGLTFSAREGWLDGAFSKLQARRTKEQITLGVCFPHEREIQETLDGVTWYGFKENLLTPEVYDAGLEERFAAIVEDFQPDVLHVHGTEFPHALAALRAFASPARALLSIQGLCSSIAAHYLDGLPEEAWRLVTFRDRLRNDTLLNQKQKFKQRAEHEEEAVCLAGHIAGRTRFDYEETRRMHGESYYHHINESLRATFYKSKWDAGAIREHSIFLPQGDYPLKGFHDVLRAMPQILADYPDAHLYVAGNSLIGGGDYDGIVPLPIRISGYGKYLRRLIAQNRLQKKVTMLGKLTAEQMKAQYLRSNVFVCASAVENSPNALGEAMLLGLPCVATKTGGIPSLLEEGKEGILYEPGDVDALAAAVKQIFAERVISLVYGDNARRRALVTHDRDANTAALIAVYREIAG